jgi:hypothetical protein
MFGEALEGLVGVYIGLHRALRLKSCSTVKGYSDSVYYAHKVLTLEE